MKLSIILISYNAANDLRSSLACALSLRTRNPLEVLVVDDGSTDATPSVMANLQADFPQLRYIRSDINLGRAGARNLGIAQASGDYICFLDADDYLLANAIDSIEDALADQPDILVTQRHDIEQATGQRASGSSVDSIYAGISFLTDCSQYPAVFRDNFITGKFFRTAFLSDNKIRFSDKRRNAEDILFSTSVFLEARAVTVLDTHFYVYLRGGYKTKFSARKCEDVIANTLDIAGMARAQTKVRKAEVLSSKVATIFYETFRRAQDVLVPDTVLDIYKAGIDPAALTGLAKPRFASLRAQAAFDALKSGDVRRAMDIAQ
jgi:glycosyltransferase involved in cell wall biosynthesis